MPTLKKERIDIRLTDEDKSVIEEAAILSNLSVSQFVISSAAERATEVIEQHRRIVLCEDSWKLVMDAINNPDQPNDRMKRAAERLKNLRT
ncbi:TPA: DUF1778 domain-containing protein [Klebsiella oxytoca]|nr:DUF1778 domain-containing protein [Klebsiella oxytoca]